MPAPAAMTADLAAPGGHPVPMARLLVTPGFSPPEKKRWSGPRLKERTFLPPRTLALPCPLTLQHFAISSPPVKGKHPLPTTEPASSPVAYQSGPVTPEGGGLLFVSFLRGSFPPRRAAPAARQCRCTWGFGSVRTGPCLLDARSQLSVAHLAARSRPCRRVVVSPFASPSPPSSSSSSITAWPCSRLTGISTCGSTPRLQCLPLPESPSLPDSIGSRLQQGNISESRPARFGPGDWDWDCQSSADCGELPQFVIASSHPIRCRQVSTRLSNQSLPGTGSSSFLVLSGRPSAPFHLALHLPFQLQASLSSSFPALTRNLFSTAATRQAKQRADQTPRVTGTGLSLSGALHFVKPATDASYRPPACLDLY